MSSASPQPGQGALPGHAGTSLESSEGVQYASNVADMLRELQLQQTAPYSTLFSDYQAAVQCARELQVRPTNGGGGTDPVQCVCGGLEASSCPSTLPTCPWICLSWGLKGPRKVPRCFPLHALFCLAQQGTDVVHAVQCLLPGELHGTSCCVLQIRVAQLDKEAQELRDENVSLSTRVGQLQDIAAQDFAAQVRSRALWGNS